MIIHIYISPNIYIFGYIFFLTVQVIYCSSYLLQLQLLFLADVNDSAIKNIEVQVWVILRLYFQKDIKQQKS